MKMKQKTPPIKTRSKTSLVFVNLKMKWLKLKQMHIVVKKLRL